MAYIITSEGAKLYYRERPGSPEESYTPQNGGYRARRTFDVDWQTRDEFIREMIGFSTVGENWDSTYRTVSRVPPKGYMTGITPYDQIRPTLYPVSCERVEGVGIDRLDTILPNGMDNSTIPMPVPLDTTYSVKKNEDGNYSADTVYNDNDDFTMPVFNYRYARITLGYEMVPYGVYSDAEMKANKWTKDGTTTGPISETTMRRYVSRHIQPTIEAIKLPFGQMKYTSTPKIPAATGLHRLLIGHEIQFTWHQVPAMPIPAFNLIGKVNNADLGDFAPGFNQEEFSLTSFVYPKWTLLCLAVEAKSYRVIGGLFNTDVLMRFKYIPNFIAWGAPNNPKNTFSGHRGIIRYYSGKDSIPSPPPAGAPSQYYDYETVTSDGTTSGTYLYDEADFTELFLLG